MPDPDAVPNADSDANSNRDTFCHCDCDTTGDPDTKSNDYTFAPRCSGVEYLDAAAR